jgi:hypothetical protein
MRKLLLLLIVAAATIWMFRHPDDLRSHSTVVFAKISHFFSSLAGQPDEVTNAQTTRQLPDGVYCLTQPVQLTFPGGTTIQRAGALVRKTGDGGNGKVLVTDEVGNAVVSISMLTRDPVLMANLNQNSLEPGPRPMAVTTATSGTKQLQEIDIKLASLRAELASIQERDRLAQRTGRKVHFATTESFVVSAITSLERLRAQLVAQNSRR